MVRMIRGALSSRLIVVGLAIIARLHYHCSSLCLNVQDKGGPGIAKERK